MKKLSSALRLLLFALSLGILLSAAARADQTWTGDGGSGGNGTWDMGFTPDWDAANGDPSTGQVWNGGDDQAKFTTAPGTVTVNDNNPGFPPVSADGLFFNASAGTYDITGDDITITGDAFSPVTLGSGDVANVLIDSNLILGDTHDNYNFQNNSSANMTLNGNVTLAGTQTTPDGNGNLPVQEIRLDANVNGSGTGAIIVNGAISGGGDASKIEIGERSGGANGVYVFGSKANLTGITNGVEIVQGTILFEGTNLGTAQFEMFGAKSSLLTNDALTITNNFGVRAGGNGTVGGNTAQVSTFSGGVHADDDTAITVTAAAGGRVNFTGNISGELPIGLTKTGAGVVVLANAAGNSIATGSGNTNSGTQAADLQAGTTLITNTSGSAFGNNPGAVKLEAGATLGGSGISANLVNAVDSTSVISAGDSGINGGVASIGTLHLTGGLSATSGLTMAFKLTSPGSSDALDMAGGNFTLSGNVTVNLSAFGTVQEGTYTLASGTAGTGVWSDGGATFAFTPPAGASVTGYDFDTTNDQFTVTLGAAPEPSTYALMGLGAVFLVWRLRRKNATI